MPRRYHSVRIDGFTPSPSGGLRIDAYPTRAGVLVYRQPDGTIRRELRPPEEVFHPDSLASLRGAPVTDLHPEDPVTAENWKALAVGHVGDLVTREGDLVAAPHYVQDERVIGLIQAGERKELSCGYMARLDETPGVWNGQPYDVVQRDIRYNHVALLEAGCGRAGKACALRLDALDAEEYEGPMLIKINGKDYEAGSAEAQAAIQALEGTRDKANGRADAAEKALATAQKELAAERDPKAVSAKVAARVKLVQDCGSLTKAKGSTLGAAVKSLKKDAAASEADAEAGGSDNELILAAIQMWDPAFEGSGKSDDYIKGAFEVALHSLAMQAGAAGAEDAKVETQEPPPPAGPPPTMQQNGASKLDGARNAIHAKVDSRTDSDDPEERNKTWASSAHTKPLTLSRGN